MDAIAARTARRDFLKRILSAAALPGLPAPAATTEQPLHLLTYDHGGLVLWGIPHFVQTLTQALEWLDRYPRFKIGLDNEAYMYDYLAAHDPATLSLIQQALAKYRGRFGIGSCTYGQPLMCFLNEESNIRQIQFAAKSVERHFGRPLSVYLMSEHAMHCQIPQILAGLDFWGAIMRTHFMMYGYNPTFDVGFGEWVGLDGTKIPAIPTYTGEGAQFGKTTVDDWILTRCPGPECEGQSLGGFREEFRKIHPLLASRADDAALRRESLVKEVENDPGCDWVLLEDLPRIFIRPQADLNAGPNDFVVRMPWGYCGNEIWNRNRRAEATILTADAAAAIAACAVPEHISACAQDLDQSWRNLLLAQHHDIQICGLVPDARKYLGASLEFSQAVIRRSLNVISCRQHVDGTVQITVFNPSSWARREWIEVAVDLPNHYASALAIRHEGKAVPFEIMSAFRGSNGNLEQATLAIRVDVPPLAAKAYSLEAAPEAAGAANPGEISASRIENGYWSIELHPEGGLASLTGIETGKPLLAAGKRSAFFAGVIDGKPCESQGKWHVLNASPQSNYVEAHEHGEIGGIPYLTRLRLWRDSPRLEFHFRFEFENQMIGRLSSHRRDAVSAFIHEEKLRLKLFPALEKDEITGIRDLPFAIAQTPDRYIQGIYWTAVAGKQSGLAVLNRGTMALVREDDGGVSVPLAYSMYYVWGTRILNGAYAYELALLPFETAWTNARLHRHALEYTVPLQSSASAPGDGSLGSVFRPIQIECESAIATAVYARNGKTFLRLFAPGGSPGIAHISAGDKPLYEADLRDRTGKPVVSPLRLRPWQFRTVAF
jgi:alpha-mannosidase